MSLAPSPSEPYIEKLGEPGDEPVFKWRFQRDPTKAAGLKGYIEHELDALRRQHDLLPEYFPEPWYAIYDGDGRELAGFAMEPLDLWKPVMEAPGFLDPASAEAIYGELEHAVEVLHENDVPHGDLENNAWIDMDGGLALIDPLGYREENVWQQALTDRDRQHLETFRDILL